VAEWFRRKSQNIKTSLKKDIADGAWIKCDSCGEVIHRKILIDSHYICSVCNFHFRISTNDYQKLIFDDGDIEYIKNNIKSNDPLKFKANKSYSEQIESLESKKADAISIAIGTVDGYKIMLGVMDFSYIGGSLGSVVGEKISKCIDRAISEKIPLVIICASGGARMQEGAISLMQLAKISAKISELKRMKGLYVSVLTDPTTGGTTASFAMQGDIIIAEPNALIGFAGARVIKQTIGEDLPDGFQKSEFLLEKGFIDHIVSRNNMKESLSKLISFFYKGKMSE